MLVRRRRRALGSTLELLLDDSANPTTIDAAWNAAVEVFGRVDDAMSRFRDDSELTRLNRRDGPVAGVSRMLLQALLLADRARRVTGGRFDPRIVADLERLGAPGVPQAVRSNRVRVVRPDGWAAGQPSARLVHVQRRTGEVQLPAPVDLGGLGKGLALRWAARAVSTRLPGSGFLLDAGGDIVCRGTPQDEPWSIGIEDPHGGVEPVATCRVWGSEAIATSSVRVGRWLDPRGHAVHHLIDPGTGAPGGDGLSAVTVVAPDPAWAEIWSKALFLAGATEIVTEARQRGLPTWWVSESGELSMTPAARQRTTWVRSESRPIGVVSPRAGSSGRLRASPRAARG